MPVSITWCSTHRAMISAGSSNCSSVTSRPACGLWYDHRTTGNVRDAIFECVLGCLRTRRCHRQPNVEGADRPPANPRDGTSSRAVRRGSGPRAGDDGRRSGSLRRLQQTLGHTRYPHSAPRPGPGCRSGGTSGRDAGGASTSTPRKTALSYIPPCGCRRRAN